MRAVSKSSLIELVIEPLSKFVVASRVDPLRSLRFKEQLQVIVLLLLKQIGSNGVKVVLIVEMTEFLPKVVEALHILFAKGKSESEGLVVFLLTVDQNKARINGSHLLGNSGEGVSFKQVLEQVEH